MLLTKRKKRPSIDLDGLLTEARLAASGDDVEAGQTVADYLIDHYPDRLEAEELECIVQWENRTAKAVMELELGMYRLLEAEAVQAEADKRGIPVPESNRRTLRDARLELETGMCEYGILQSD